MSIEQKRDSLPPPELIDLTGAPSEPAVPPRFGTAVARMPAAGLVDLVDILEDGDEEETATRPVVFKTDPNEREFSETDGVGQARRDRKRSRHHIRFDAEVEIVESKSTRREATPPQLQVDEADVHVVKTAPGRPELQVLDVFPDVDMDHVNRLLVDADFNVALVIAQLAEKSYPKAKAPAKRQTEGSIRVHRPSTKKWQYDFMSPSSFEPSELYTKEALQQLASDFPFLSKRGVKQLLSKNHNHYALCHDKILCGIKGSEARPGESLEQVQYRRLLSASAGYPLHKNQIKRIDDQGYGEKVVLKNPRKTGEKCFITEQTLQEEVCYVKEKLSGWMETAKRNLDRLKEQAASKEQGTAIECSCCFEENAFENMVACRDEGHLFCTDCLKSFAENQIFGNGNLGIDTETKLPAMTVMCFHGDGCRSHFDRLSLEKALPAATLKKFDEVQFQTSIERAGLSDMVSCPRCNFSVVLPPTEKILACPVEECRFVSCRECGEAEHIPLRCDEVEKEHETKGRLTVEEAISAAKIRDCPKCRKSFIKSDGCNKIRCGCGIYVCYVCRKQIKGYDHFCQTPHCKHANCIKCPLWTNSETDDAQAMREAGLKAAENVGAHEKGGSVNVDVDSILKAP